MKGFTPSKEMQLEDLEEYVERIFQHKDLDYSLEGMSVLDALIYEEEHLVEALNKGRREAVLAGYGAFNNEQMMYAEIVRGWSGMPREKQIELITKDYAQNIMWTEQVFDKAIEKARKMETKS